MCSDDEYRSAGVTVSADPVPGADVVLSVQPLDLARARDLPVDVVTISFLPIGQHAGSALRVTLTQRQTDTHPTFTPV